jgi:MFS family permease
MLLSSLGTSIANVALPTLAEAFGASFGAVQWVVLAYLLASTALIVGVGRLGDMVGRRRLLVGGIALFTAASTLCGTASTLWMLIAARGAQGLGAAVMMALAMAIVGAAVPRARTGIAMGLLGTMSAIGTALGPSLGGVLIAGLGWRAVFLVSLPVGLLTLVLARRHLPADPAVGSRPRGRFDTLGTLVLAATLSAYALAVTLGGGGFGPVNLALLLAAAAGAGLFLLRQSRAASPLIQLATLRDPALAARLAAALLVATVMMATLVVGPFYLSGALGLGAAAVGLVMSLGPVVAAFAGVPAGRLVDRWGPDHVTALGLGGMVLGLALLALLPSSFGIAGYAAPVSVVTAAYALFQAANNTAVMAQADPARRGLVAALLNLSRNLGLITGASAMGAVFAAAAGASSMATAAPEAIAGGMRMTFALAAMLVACALPLPVLVRFVVRRTPAPRP